MRELIVFLLLVSVSCGFQSRTAVFTGAPPQNFVPILCMPGVDACITTLTTAGQQRPYILNYASGCGIGNSNDTLFQADCAICKIPMWMNNGDRIQMCRCFTDYCMPEIPQPRLD